MNQIHMNSQDKINLMNNKGTPWELMYRWLQIIQGLWSEKSHSCVRCGTKQGIFLTVPHSTLEHFWPASPQLWWYNCWCSANLFNDESFGALNSEKKTCSKSSALPSVLTCMKCYVSNLVISATKLGGELMRNNQWNVPNLIFDFWSTDQQ